MKHALPLAALLSLAACDSAVKISEKDGVQVTSGDKQVSITDQGGVSVTDSATGQPVSIAQIGGQLAEATERMKTDISGLAVGYPGASRTNVSADWKLFGDNAGPKVTTEFTTTDSPEKVAAFYDAKMKALGVTPVVSAQADGTIARVVSTNNGASVVAIGIEPRDGVTRIRIEKRMDKAKLAGTLAGG